MMSERAYLEKPNYQGDGNYGPKSGYLDKIAGMDERQLMDECKDKIWMSAYTSNKPQSDYHWQCDACCDECVYRDRLDIYERAYLYHTDGY